MSKSLTFGVISAVMLPWMMGAANLDISATPRISTSLLIDPANASLLTVSNTPRSRVINMGDRGQIVSQIQFMLKALGLYDDDVDGVYTPETALSVSQFQRSHNLAVTGNVDRTTWNDLRAAFEQVRSQTSESPDTEPQLTGLLGDRPLNNDLPRDHLGSSEARLKSATASPDSVTEQSVPHSVISDRNALKEIIPPENAEAKILPSADRTSETRSQLSPVAEEMRVSQTHSSNSLRPIRWGAFGVIALAIASLFYQLGRMNRPVQFRLAQRPQRTGRSPKLPLLNAADPQADRPNPTTSVTVAPTPLSSIRSTPRMTPPTEVEICQHNLHSSDPAVRRKAIWQLGRIGTTESIQPLVNLMLKADSQQRSLILAAISEIGVRTLQPLSHALITSMQDDSSDVRKNAIRDITRVYELMGQVTAILRHAVDDSDEDVRQTASWALNQFSSLRLNPKLMLPSESSPHETSITLIHPATTPESAFDRDFDRDKVYQHDATV